MLNPSGDWYWYMDEESQHLAISLGKEMCFLTAYGTNRLTPFGKRPIDFCVEHLEQYAMCVDALESSSLTYSPAEKTQIALNATAAVFFHQPVSPKSWHFKPSEIPIPVSSFHYLKTELDTGLVMVIEQKQDLFTCLLLCEAISLTENKRVEQFALVKVQGDRLHQLEDFEHSFSSGIN